MRRIRWRQIKEETTTTRKGADLSVLGQVLSNSHGVLAVSLHTHSEGLQTDQVEPRVILREKHDVRNRLNARH